MGIGGNDPSATARKYLRGRIHLQLTVDHNTLRLTRGGNGTYIELRIILLYGADARHDRASTRSPGMPIIASCRGGNPLTLTVRECRATIEAGGDLQPHPGTPVLHAVKKANVHFARLIRQNTDIYRYARCTQLRDALAGYQRIGIFNRGDYTANTRSDQRLSAGRRATVMAAGLERDIGRRTAYIDTTRGSIPQRIDFGMRFTGTLGVTAGDDLSIADDHAAHARIGTGQEQAFGSLVERSAHGVDVVG
jgi:hypothetical protein